MIKANELRIGNCILPQHNLDGKYHQVKELYEGVINGYVESWYSPIILTPEILEACGFVLANGFYNKGIFSVGIIAICILMENDTLLIEDVHGDMINMERPKHLHQLQNLYFALTGEELKVNLHVEA